MHSCNALTGLVEIQHDNQTLESAWLLSLQAVVRIIDAVLYLFIARQDL